MNDVYIFALILCLFLTIALGFAVLVLHRELTRYEASQKRIRMAEDEERVRISSRISKCEDTEEELGKWITLTDQDARDALAALQNVRADIANTMKHTRGYADETEFLRLKTQCLITLPNQIAKLDAIVTGRPYIARIEKQDGLIGMRYVVDDEIVEKFEGRGKPDE